MKPALIFLFAIAAAVAQDQTGSVQGVVIDSVSRQPVKKATVSIAFTGFGLAGPAQSEPSSRTPHIVITDASGVFSFSGLSAGEYMITVTDDKYPSARMGRVNKTVQVSASDDATSVTVELIPGAAISGKIVDEDGDPMTGCTVQPNPLKNADQGAPFRLRMDRETGAYRIYNLPPGKYTVSAQCSENVFQPRPLSAGPDPPPTAAYPTLFYPAATDVSTAQVIDLAPGSEKSGIDFQMQPVSVTRIHGTMVTGSADWRGRNDLRVELLPLVRRGPGPLMFSGGEQINPKDGSFDIRRVFPGSYQLVVFSQDFGVRGPQSDAPNQVGAMMRIDVADKPVEVSVQLHRAVDLSGTVEIEQSNSAAAQLTPGQINVQLMPADEFERAPAPNQVSADGTFTVKSVLPGDWRIRLTAPSAFLKSAWFGTDDVTHKAIDLTSGVAAPLRIVVSTNTATIRGTAPPGKFVLVIPTQVDESEQGAFGFQSSYNPLAHADSNGQFSLPGLAPGKYCVTAVGGVGDLEASLTVENCPEVTVGEGETVTVDVKPATKP
ncbi:MAG TPA: carboxypeptidase-like regulatory domain-containing protein [Bryobacteraceae bacterium]|nr:carboxypeptidase-like regulatory domain-containing protein [Bryobacteraceae bacterium]